MTITVGKNSPKKYFSKTLTSVQNCYYKKFSFEIFRSARVANVHNDLEMFTEYFLAYSDYVYKRLVDFMSINRRVKEITTKKNLHPTG